MQAETDYFIFPFGFNEIADETTDQRYRVTQEPFKESSFDERRVKRTLRELEDALHNDITLIKESDRFDFLYCLIKYFEDNLDKVDIEIIERASDLLSNGLKKMQQAITKCQQSKKDNDTEEMDDFRNCFKMFIFLNFYFLNNTCIKKQKSSLKDTFEEALNQKKSEAPVQKKRKTRRRDLDNDFINKTLEKQTFVINNIKDSLDMDFKYVWGKKHIDTEFFKYYMEISIKLLESTPLLKQADINSIIFYIIEIMVTKYKESYKNIQIKLINLIYEEESLVKNVQDFILNVYKSEDANLSQIAVDTLILLTNYVNHKSSNQNYESQANKNAKEFLSGLSEKLPKLFYNNLSCFIKLYDNESYILRQSISEIICNIIKRYLVMNEDEDSNNAENHLKARKKLIDTLLTRCYDKNSFCRSHVLSCFSDLCENNVIPKDYLMKILQLAAGRMKDLSVFVRKKTIILLYQVMRFYQIIYVQSQEQQQFMTIDELSQQRKFNEVEKNDMQKVMGQIEEMMSKPEYEEKFDEHESDLNIIKRKYNEALKTEKELLEYTQVIQTMEEIMPSLIQLLLSRNNFDVIETIKFILFLRVHNIQSAEKGMQKMLHLIWSREKSVKEKMIEAYYYLYFDDKRFSKEDLAKNIINLFRDATLTDSTSLEELIMNILLWDQRLEDKEKEKKKGLYFISREVFKELWNQFISAHKVENRMTARASLYIFSFVSVYKKDLLDSNKYTSFIEILKEYLKYKNPDWVVIKYIAQIIRNCQNLKVDHLDQFVKILCYLIVAFQGTSDSEWYCACESTINMFFKLKQNPEYLAKFLIQKCTTPLADIDFSLIDNININYPQSPLRKTSSCDKDVSPNIKTPNNIIDEQEENNFENKLAQLLFIVGHCALKLLIHVDTVESRLKKLKMEGERQQAESNEIDPNDPNAKELDKVYGGLEAEFEKRVQQLQVIGEKHIIFNNIIAVFKDWVKKIVNDIVNRINSESRNRILDRVAVLTLCKFMCISSEYCKENLNILFELLGSDQDQYIKTNVIISLGDLLHKYPNLVDPYIQIIYSNLHDEDVNVRKITMMVLTHLILNDMMKIKGEICEVALLLEDPEPKITNIVKLFLHELHKKDTKMIYNLLPEAIGRMSRTESNRGFEFSEETFQNFAKNIMPFLEKDKFSEALVERLVSRFKNTENIKEHHNSAFCMGMLSYNERGLRKLIDMYEDYRDKLTDHFIMEQFQTILSKLRKFQKQEVKNLVDEFEAKIHNHKTEAFQKRKEVPQKGKKGKKNKDKMQNEGDKENSKPFNQDENSNTIQTAQKNMKKKQKQKKNQKTHDTSEEDEEISEEENYNDDLMEAEEDSVEAPPQPKIKRKRQGMRGKSANMMDIEDENNEESD